VDVSYAVVAELAGDHVPSHEQAAVVDLLRRAEVVQVAWAKRAKPQRRPARHREVLVAMVLLDHTATEQDAREVARILGASSLVSEVSIETPGSPPGPVAAVGVAEPTASRRPDPAAG
jgi:hypothetical protein